MNKFNEVLAKKRARLSKYTGRKLRRKVEAYHRAVQKFGKSDTPIQATSSKPSKPSKPVTVETGVPKWSVTPPGKEAFTVQASNEKDARAQARVTLAIRALPPGTTVERI